MKLILAKRISIKIISVFVFLSFTLQNSNAQPKIYTALTQRWTDNGWQNSSLETNIYVGDELTQTLEQNWIPATSVWENNIRIFYSYLGGNVSQVVSQNWDNTIEDWRNTHRLLYTYTSSNKISLIVVQTWVNGGWLNTSQAISSYTNNIVTNMVYQTWSLTANAWQNTVQYLYRNNMGGFPTEEVIQLWDTIAKVWVNNLRYTKTYDNANNELTSVTESWSRSTLQWMNNQRITNTYNENNKLLTATTELWLNNNWMNATMDLYSYDANNFLSGTIAQVWSLPTNMWLNNAQSIYLNNADGSISTILYQNWNSTTAAWENDELVIYTYVPLAVRNFNNKKLFSVYPNPTSENLLVNNETNITVDKIEIYDLLGKEILSQETNVESVNVQSLSQGCYVMKIYCQGNAYPYKFIRK